MTNTLHQDDVRETIRMLSRLSFITDRRDPFNNHVRKTFSEDHETLWLHLEENVDMQEALASDDLSELNRNNRT